MVVLWNRYYPDEYKDYHGCRNCKHQPEPLRMCEWGEKRSGPIELVCSRWEKEDESEQQYRIYYIERITFCASNINRTPPQTLQSFRGEGAS